MSRETIGIIDGGDHILKKKGQWTNDRLQHLFVRYNRKFWRGKLRDFRVVKDDSLPCWGQINFKAKVILVNTVDKSDRDVRNTLLHEMAHLAAGRPGHNSAFFEQLENLLRQKAPIRLGTAENQNRPFLEVIPKKFRLCREALAHTYQRRRRSIERELKKLKNVPEMSLESAVVGGFDSAGMNDVKWHVALASIGDQYGLLDIDGKPRGPEEERLIREGKKAFRWQRSIILADRRLKKESAELDVQQASEKVKG